MSDLSQVGQEFGYRFDPPCAADQPRHRKLTAIIRDTPKGQYFQPEKLDCCVANQQGELDALTVAHPWTFLNAYRLVAGQLRLIGHNNARVEVFTFGGSLRLDDGADQLTAVLASPAPLLPLLPENPFLSRLAAECEAVLARRQAEWDSQGKPDDFEARLVAAEPLALYQAVLHELAQALAAGHVFGGLADKTLEHYLAAERAGGQPARLEDLL